MPGKSVGCLRALTTVVSALVVLLGSLAAGSPAAAQDSHATALTAACRWDSEAREWSITWAITFPEQTDTYRLADLEVSPAGSAVTGPVNAEPGTFPHDPALPLEIGQRVPAGAQLATLSGQAQWSEHPAEPVDGKVSIPDDCEAPALPDLIGEVAFDCHWLRVTLENPTTEAVRLTLVPSGGGPLEVEVAGHEAAKVEFPAGEGRSVDVLLDGRSIVDSGQPIVITPAGWAALECTADGGEGADLPATGSRVLLLAGGALVLLMLGAGLYLVAARRRFPQIKE